MSHWTLSEATDLIRLLSDDLRDAGFGVGIVGSVIVKGESDNDLDITVFPLKATQYVLGDAYDALSQHMTRQADFYQVIRTWHQKGSSDTKHVEIWVYKEKRVDVFFLK